VQGRHPPPAPQVGKASLPDDVNRAASGLIKGPHVLQASAPYPLPHVPLHTCKRLHTQATPLTPTALWGTSPAQAARAKA
jgi:hypothetical protein